MPITFPTAPGSVVMGPPTIVNDELFMPLTALAVLPGLIPQIYRLPANITWGLVDPFSLVVADGTTVTTGIFADCFGDSIHYLLDRNPTGPTVEVLFTGGDGKLDALAKQKMPPAFWTGVIAGP